MDINNNNIVLQLNAKDVNGRPLRVADCDIFILHVWTDNPQMYLSYSGRDFLSTEWVDEITIPAKDLEFLNSGVLCYSYHYAPKVISNGMTEDEMRFEHFHSHPHFPHPHCHHNECEDLINSKPVVTEFYWRNLKQHGHHHNPHNPSNGVNMNDIERLRRFIDVEKLERMRDVEELKEFDNNVQSQLDALTAKNKEMNDSTDNLVVDVENKLEEAQNKVEEEELRAKRAETELSTLIETEKAERKGGDEILDTKIVMERERAQAQESNISDRIASVSEKFEAFKTITDDSLSSEVARAKANESALNDKIQGVITDLQNEVSRSADRDIVHTDLVNTESNRAQAVENKISTDLETEIARAKDAEKHILDEVHGVQDVVNNLANATDVYTKSEVDNKVNEVKNSVSTLENKFNNHLTTASELSDKVTKLVGDVDKAKSDILTEVAKCDAANNKLDTDLKTLSDSFDEYKSNHLAETNELKEKVTKNIADTEKVSNDLATETTNRLNAETTLETKISVAEGKVDAEVERAKAQEKLIADEVAEIKENATAKHTELADSISNVEANLTLEIARAKAAEKVNGDAIEIINGDVETNGSIKKSLADSKAYTDAEIAKLNLAKDAEIADTLKSYATNESVDKKIEELVGTAPEALDTLGEIANVLSQDSDAISAINEVLSGKANASDVYTKSETDTKVTAINNAISTLVTKSDNADSTINGRIDDLVAKVSGIETNVNGNNDALVTAIASEETARKEADKTISDKLDSELAKVNAKVTELNEKVITDIADSSAKDTELESRISANETLISNLQTNLIIIHNRSNDKDNELVANDTELEAKIQTNTDNLNSEIARAKQVEKEINDKINSIDLDGANSSISQLNDALNSEISRATAKETTLEDAIKTANESIIAERERARDVEQTLRDNLEAIDLTPLTNSISSLDTKVDNEIARATAAEKANADNITKLSDNIKAVDDKVNAIDLTPISNSVSTLDAKVDNEIERAKNAEKINSDNITSLQSSVSSISSLNASMTQEIADRSAKDSEIESNLNTEKTRAENAEKALEDKVAVINGDKETVGSIAHAVEDANHYTDDEIAKVNSAINTHISDAESKYQPKGNYLTEHQDISNLATKTEVNDAIQKVVGAAPLALDTLEEIANKLGDNDDVVAGIINTLSDKANSADVYTKADVDKAVEDAVKKAEEDWNWYEAD